jgi:Aspartyl protease
MCRIAVILCISCYLWIAGCMNLAPAQPSTLMREVAEACAHQFPGIEVKNVTPFGRLVYGYGKLGQAYRDAFLACYQARVGQEIQAFVAPGHPASFARVGAHTMVPITQLEDTVLVPVTLNHTRQVALMMDPGTSNTILNPAVLAQLGVLVPPNARRWTVTLEGHQPLSMPLVRVSSLAMGALAVEDLDVGLSDAFPRVPGADGVLGADVLDYFRLMVDRASRQLTLEVIHSTAAPKKYPVEAIVDPGADGD